MEKEKKKVLIVIDVQNDFVTGSLGTPEAQAIVPNIVKKVEEYRSNEDGIIFTKDIHYDNYLETAEGKKLPIPHCIAGTVGCDIIPELNPDLSLNLAFNEKIYNKETFGYHWDHAAWLGWLRDAKPIYKIEIIGLCTDICVVTNALCLKTCYPNIELTVDASCCAGTTPDKHKAALDVMESCQINVINKN